MKINKTIDVSDYPDTAIQNFERFAGMSGPELDAILAGAASVANALEKEKEAIRIIKKVIHVLDQPEYNSSHLTHREMACGIREVLTKQGFQL